MHNHRFSLNRAHLLQEFSSWLCLQAIGIAILLFCHGLRAETFNSEAYRQFEAGDTLAKIKYAFPNAVMVNVNEAWVKNNESVIKMSGPGINGSLLLDFRKAGSSRESVTFATPDEQLILNWVRWTSTSGLPLENLESRYGKAEKCDVRDDTLQAYCAWEKLGVLAYLDVKKKTVMSTEYSYIVTGWKNPPPPKPMPDVKHKAKPKAEASAQEPGNPRTDAQLDAKQIKDGRSAVPLVAAPKPAEEKPLGTKKVEAVPAKTPPKPVEQKLTATKSAGTAPVVKEAAKPAAAPTSKPAEKPMEKPADQSVQVAAPPKLPEPARAATSPKPAATLDKAPAEKPAQH